MVEQALFGTSGRDCWQGDQASINHIVSTFVADRAERRSVKLWLKQRAKEVTKQPFFVEAVKVVARELAESKFLSGERVEEIVREVKAGSSNA
jgi:hypothetical protein